jgi:hypothetical protein
MTVLTNLPTDNERLRVKIRTQYYFYFEQAAFVGTRQCCLCCVNESLAIKDIEREHDVRRVGYEQIGVARLVERNREGSSLIGHRAFRGTVTLRLDAQAHNAMKVRAVKNATKDVENVL